MAAWIVLALSIGNAHPANGNAPPCQRRVSGRELSPGPRECVLGHAGASLRYMRVWISGRPGAIHAVGDWTCEGLYEVGR